VVTRRRRSPSHLRGASLLVVPIVLAGVALTATSTVPSSRADDVSRATGVNDVKPVECAGLALTRILAGSGAIDDPNGNASLVLGSAGADTITARNRDDCLVAGAGDDALDGGAGRDVCIGGPGGDVFLRCETTYQ
jgi:Ca2+-binding RTX toxin-like protein